MKSDKTTVFAHMHRVLLLRLASDRKWSEPRSASSHMLIYVIEGDFFLNCGGVDYRCSPDSVLYWPLDTRYYISDPGLADKTILVVFFELLPSGNDDIHAGCDDSVTGTAEDSAPISGGTESGRIPSCGESGCELLDSPFQLNDIPGMRDYFTDLQNTAMKKDAYRTAEADARLTILLIELLRAAGNDSCADYDSDVEGLLASIRIAAGRRASCSQIAAELGYTDTALNRIVRRAVGESLRDYIFMTKIRMAEDMLLHSNLTVSSIADELGFTDSSHLIRVFREFNGTTPLKYRMEHSN
ncbi:MAG: helix-turn-helix transcriptional regulator [Clostridiales bacterium]|nr:helix-turn-helix transcriptional regulator [Clostridiales bacterium]